jgi:hypothetical protein
LRLPNKRHGRVPACLREKNIFLGRAGNEDLAP